MNIYSELPKVHSTRENSVSPPPGPAASVHSLYGRCVSHWLPSFFSGTRESRNCRMPSFPKMLPHTDSLAPARRGRAGGVEPHFIDKETEVTENSQTDSERLAELEAGPLASGRFHHTPLCLCLGPFMASPEYTGTWGAWGSVSCHSRLPHVRHGGQVYDSILNCE